MKYNIKVNKLNNDEWSTKAFVSLTINDSFKINDITVRESKDGSLFVAMPGYRTNKVDEYGNPVYRNYCYPITAEFRKELFDNILKAYEKDKEVTVNPKTKKLTYEVNMFACNGNTNIESMGRVKFDDCFVVDGLKVIDSEKGSFVAMPSKGRTGEDGNLEYTDICYPVTKEFREKLYTEVIKKNSELKNKGKDDFDKVAKEVDELSKDDDLPFR